MDVDIYPMKQIFNSGERYVIPAYQRPYTWEDEHVEQLINDINESQRGESEDGYFIGSIIVIKRDDEKYEVVDGQQRLVTLTLIFRQLAKYLEEGSDAHVDLKKFYMTKDSFTEGSTSVPVVEVSDTEQGVYLAILEGVPIQEKRMTKAQKVFANNVKSIERCLREVLGDQGNRRDVIRLIRHIRDKVRVVFLKVDGMDNAYRLFNVLNNRGTPLNDADLLKSKLLELARHDEVAFKKVQSDWREIERLADERDLNTFLSINQISEKMDRDRAVKPNYKYYEEILAKKYSKNSTVLVEFLLKSAQNYQEVISAENDISRNARNVIKSLLRLSPRKEWLPAFLAYLNKCDEGVYDRRGFPDLVELFEKVYMQRFLAGVSASQRVSPCYFAIEAINQKKEFHEIIATVKKQSINKEFKKALDSDSFYDASRPRVVNLVKCVLLRIDDAKHDGTPERVHNLKTITVEHIMPQNMGGGYWQERFTQDQHDAWLHRIGNLTLLPRGKNSAARNLGFPEKKVAYQRANEKSGYEITKDVCERAEWTEWDITAIQKRHNEMKEKIIELWGIEEQPSAVGEGLDL